MVTMANSTEKEQKISAFLVEECKKVHYFLFKAYFSIFQRKRLKILSPLGNLFRNFSKMTKNICKKLKFYVNLDILVRAYMKN